MRWTIQDNDLLIGAKWWIIDDVTIVAHVWEKEHARLIAAAPELLEACEAVYNSVTDEPSTIPGPAFAKVMNAIAKARGER